MHDSRPRRDAVRTRRRYPLTWGAESAGDGEMRFTLWAPELDRLVLRLDGKDHDMISASHGWFELRVAGVRAGARYAYVLPDGRGGPDPASRAQDGGIDGPSLVVDPEAYRWRHADWKGRPWEEAVFYELHMGAFTPEGTFGAAIDKLPHLAELGITAIELMPLAQFPGDRGWGYDGVLLYAPHHAYGTPDDLKALVDAAHGYGMMVFLDVVYNHFGPQGNYLPSYAGSFFSRGQPTPWGDAIDFSERPVRDFFVDNSLYWLTEYNFDGLRIDAVHAIEDEASEIHIIAELAARVRSSASGRRRHLVVEDCRNITRFLMDDDGSGSRIDAGWNDEFHHAAHILLTGETGGHLAGLADTAWKAFGTALAQGYVTSATLDGVAACAPAALGPASYVAFLQNHDQIGNRAYGDRVNAKAGRAMLEAFETILMLAPAIPMLFMGQEHDAEDPFRFFCDYQGDIAAAFREGRMSEAISFGSLPEDTEADDLPDPNAANTFSSSKLDWSRPETTAGAGKRAFFRKLIELRRIHVIPYLKHTPSYSGQLLCADDGLLAVDWHLAGRTLELRANLTALHARLPDIKGSRFHVHAGTEAIDETDDFPPMTVIFAGL